MMDKSQSPPHKSSGPDSIDPTVFEIITTILSAAGAIEHLVRLLTWYKGRRRAPTLRAQIEAHAAKTLVALDELESALNALGEFLSSIHFDVSQKVRIGTSVFVTTLARYYVFKGIAQRMRRIRDAVETVLDHYEELATIGLLGDEHEEAARSYHDSVDTHELDRILAGLGEVSFDALLKQFRAFVQQARAAVRAAQEALGPE